MLSLSKKTDYALIALSELAEEAGRVASARQIAARYGLPVSMLMNILKRLAGAGVIQSIRGTKGGYRLAVDPHRLSLHELVLVVDGEMRLIDCGGETSGCERPICRVRADCPVQAPLLALHHQLARFLKDVKVSDLILRGHRIDVPLEQVGGGERG